MKTIQIFAGSKMLESVRFEKSIVDTISILDLACLHDFPASGEIERLDFISSTNVTLYHFAGLMYVVTTS